MAINYSVPSMIQESIIEKLLVSKYCIEYPKDPSIWGSQGCYGHPAIVLLLSIADTIGSFVIDSRFNKDSFEIFNTPFYGMSLSKKEFEVVYKQYRNLSTHNSVIGINSILDIGSVNNKVIEFNQGRYTLYLVPLYQSTQKAVHLFFSSIDETVGRSKRLQKILQV